MAKLIHGWRVHHAYFFIFLWLFVFSVLTQLLLIAREKKKGSSLLVLDESLASMKKSGWAKK